MVDHDAVDVVDDLCLVAELDRYAEASFSYRPSISVVQGDDPGRPVGNLARQPEPGLSRDLLDQAGSAFQVVD